MSGGSLTREERLERQDLDLGDPDDTVHIQKNGISTASKAYHDDPECDRINRDKEDLEDMSREEAQVRWRHPCGDCCDIEDKD